MALLGSIGYSPQVTTMIPDVWEGAASGAGGYLSAVDIGDNLVGGKTFVFAAPLQYTIPTDPRPRYVSGTVEEDGTPVVRMVRAYRRDNGAFLGQTMSGPDGKFQLRFHGFSGKVFVIAFDDDNLPQYNAQVYDDITPL